MWFPIAALALASTNPDAPIVVDGMLCHPTRLMVKLDSLKDVGAIQVGGATIYRTYPEIKWAAVEVPQGKLLATRDLIQKVPGVTTVTLDRCAKTAYIPNDPLFNSSWHQFNVKNDLALGLTFGSPTRVVAIIDTGVDRTHEDIVKKLWTNPYDRTMDGIDNDHDGIIDDINGADFAYGDNDPDDQHGHGTCCAGIAAGAMNNHLGGCGTGGSAKIMCLKAATDDGYFYDSANVGAYLYAAAHKANILSCSFFSDRVSQSEEDALDYCVSKNILPVVAMGNDNSVIPYYPSSYNNVLGVAAIVQSNAKASFSNYGDLCDVGAPGVSIVAPVHGGGYTSGFAGTSAACPVTAGVAALVWGSNTSLTAQQVRSILEDTAIPVTNDFANYGRIDSFAAVQVAKGLMVQPSKSALVRYVSPIDGKTTRVHRIYGRGFGAPHAVVVKASSYVCPIVSQTRDYVDAQVPYQFSSLSVYVDGSLVSSFTRPDRTADVFPLAEAGVKNGGTITWNFKSALNVDGLTTNVTSNGDTIRMEGVFRNVALNGSQMTLKYVRQYTGIVTKDTVYLYNWNTASYPYGSFDKVYDAPASIGSLTSNIVINNAQNYVDPDGSVIMIIEGTSTASNSVLKINQVHLRQ